jgi:hypothetical protein
MSEVAYCVRCKSKEEVKNPEVVQTKNGRRRLKGTCIKCGCGMSKILGKA